MITEEEKSRIEQAFIDRCKALGIKFKSKKFYELQTEFFVGAMTALNINLPIWTISIMSGREIVTF